MADNCKDTEDAGKIGKKQRITTSTQNSGLRVLLVFCLVFVGVDWYFKRPYCPKDPLVLEEGEVDEIGNAVGGIKTVFKMKELVYELQTPFQYMQVFHHETLGTVFVLDGAVQFTERFEAHYHEMMAHVPIAYTPNAKRVLIMGGGDGGAMARFFAHPSIEKVVLVEIDEKVPETVRKYFPHLDKAFEDPRCELLASDAIAYVFEMAKKLRKMDPEERKEHQFDVVIIDSTDSALGNGKSSFLGGNFAFYASIKQLMTPNGILIENGETPTLHTHTMVNSLGEMKKLFRYVAPYLINTPDFLMGTYLFYFCSDVIDPHKMQHIEWNSFVERKIKTQYYNSGVHIAAFQLPQIMLSAMERKSISFKPNDEIAIGLAGEVDQ